MSEVRGRKGGASVLASRVSKNKNNFLCRHLQGENLFLPTGPRAALRLPWAVMFRAFSPIRWFAVVISFLNSLAFDVSKAVAAGGD